MQIEAGIYKTRQGSLAEVHFQVWDGCWVGKENDELRIWKPDGEERGEDTALELVKRVGELD